MIDSGRYVVLVPLHAMPAAGVTDALRARAEALQQRRGAGTATSEELEALRALSNVLGDEAPGATAQAEPGVARAAEPPVLLKIPEVARLLGLSRSSVESLLARGELPCVRIGKSVRIRRDQLMTWLDEATAEQQGSP